MTTIVRSGDRPVLERGRNLPTLQRLVDRSAGSSAMTVLINRFSGDESIPSHTHDVEEVLVVTNGEWTVTVDGSVDTVAAGDAVIVPPGAAHSIDHRSDNVCTVVAVLTNPDVRIGGNPTQGAWS